MGQEITEYGAQELKNKTIISPVIQGVVDSGTGLTFGKINAGATNVTTLGVSSTLKVTGNTNVGNVGISGVANFNSNVGIVGSFIFNGPIKWNANATLATNGLTLNANFYLKLMDAAGTTFFLPCANAAW